MSLLCGCLDPVGPMNAVATTKNQGLDGIAQRRVVKTAESIFAYPTPEQQPDLIPVIVPEGVSPGQTIQVVAPDGRTVQVAVPASSSPGSKFMVEFPIGVAPNPGRKATSVSETATVVTSSPIVKPLPTVGDSKVTLALPHVNTPPFVESHNQSSPPRPAATSSAEPTDSAVPDSPVSEAPASESAAPVAAPIVPAALPTVAPSMPVAPPDKCLVLVRVPPGTQPGATLHVKIPGENRVVAAQVPPGDVEQFHVAYEPSKGDMNTAPASEAPPIQTPAPVTAAPPQENEIKKFILVQVPLGTLPGTILYVQIPGENRIIPAQVPSGNVKQFHIAYPDQSQSLSSVPQQQQQQQQQYQQQFTQTPSPAQHGYYGNDNHPNEYSNGGYGKPNANSNAGAALSASDSAYGRRNKDAVESAREEDEY